MKSYPQNSILSEMRHEVVEYLEVIGTRVTQRSFFAKELAEIEDLRRRNVLRQYVSETLVIMLGGVLDQVRSLDAILMVPGTMYTKWILIRTTFEYLDRISYLADSTIGTNERACRALRLYSGELLEYKKLPEPLRPRGTKNKLSKRLREARTWYTELTGNPPSRVNAKELFDTAWGSDKASNTWMGVGSTSPLYATAYRLGSAVVHGNLWFLRHFAPPTLSFDSHLGLESGKDREGTISVQWLAAGALMFSFGFTVALLDVHPSDIMKKLDEKIADIR